MQPKTRPQIWRMRARELQNAAEDAHDPIAREAYLSQARRFSRRARRESIGREPLERRDPRNPSVQHVDPFPPPDRTEKAWPWIGLVSLLAATGCIVFFGA
jgi:hypothetical protein